MFPFLDAIAARPSSELVIDRSDEKKMLLNQWKEQLNLKIPVKTCPRTGKKSQLELLVDHTNHEFQFTQL